MGELEQLAFESMARLYPHEIYALRPDDFWDYFYSQQPSASREEMERLLGETEFPSTKRSY